jgi:fatty-acyl-CoA synthase
MPKGVIWTHRALFLGALGGGGIYQQLPPISQAQELAQRVALAPHLTFLAIAPMMHGAALWSSLISLFAGHTVVVSEQTHFDAAHIWSLVQSAGVNVMTVVGDSMALPLVQALEAEPARWDLSRLMIFGNGGALLSSHLQTRLLAALPQLRLSNGMGSSETGVMGGGERPAQGDGFMVLQARPDLAVLSDDLRILRAPGERGVLARTGPTPIGYYGDAQKTAEVFVTIDGVLWVRSGDQARIDANGDIVVLGRDSQCITTGGEKVFTEEVEEVLRRDPAVADVLVVGLPDARWGQQVTAVLSVANGAALDTAALLTMCRQHLAGYKIPKAVFVAPSIRRSDAGKADYRWALEFAKAQAAATAGPSP